MLATVSKGDLPLNSITLTREALAALVAALVALGLLAGLPIAGAPLWATLLGWTVAAVGTACVLATRYLISKAVESTLDGLALVIDFSQRGPRPPVQSIPIRRRNDV